MKYGLMLHTIQWKHFHFVADEVYHVSHPGRPCDPAELNPQPLLFTSPLRTRVGQSAAGGGGGGEEEEGGGKRQGEREGERERGGWCWLAAVGAWD